MRSKARRRKKGGKGRLRRSFERGRNAIRMKQMRQAFAKSRKSRSKFSSAFNRGKTILSKNKAAQAFKKKRDSMPGAKAAKKYTASQRTKRGWEARKSKYGPSGFKQTFNWGGKKGRSYYTKRYYGQRTLGKKRRTGKGGGFRRQGKVR